MPRKVPNHNPHQGLSPIRPVKPKRSADDAAWKAFIDGRPWKKLSALYRAKHPLCEWCLSAHRHAVPAEHTHHMKGQDMEHAFNEEWLISLCKSCHSRVTLMERRGQTVEYPPRRHDPKADAPPGYS